MFNKRLKHVWPIRFYTFERYVFIHFYTCKKTL